MKYYEEYRVTCQVCKRKVSALAGGPVTVLSRHFLPAPPEPPAFALRGQNGRRRPKDPDAPKVTQPIQMDWCPGGMREAPPTDRTPRERGPVRR